ncbi:MAG: VOC family protein [Sphingomonas sp.]|uniref:VOC family protein n=1 Tax=Sphingomonas sp. TaxID=28214 RepID=UPI001ACF1E4F|nr:VOC family protein [Sphingomonas sp.]MBN8808712.1 VOC family protein [Sphingomonas sp.]
MSGLRLRQVCLADAALEPAVADLRAIFAVEVGVRDYHVDIYGLSNAVLPFGADFIEIVAPAADDTAVGRFLQRGDARGAYMAIFQCDDPERRQDRAERLGVRTPHVIDRPDYRNVQLHPKDGRATILEFARSAGEDDDWWPAGPDWRQYADADDAHARIAGLEIASPDPEGLAAHWAAILDVAVERCGTAPTLVIGGRTLSFTEGVPERVAALSVAVADPEKALAIARARGRLVRAGRFALAGVDFHPVAHDLRRPHEGEAAA